MTSETTPAIPERSSHIIDVIIIGAGAAGLMAAFELSKHDKKVTVLEARDRIGGRIHTLHKDFSVPAEAGAEFIHGDLAITGSLIREAGISTIPVRGKAWNVENGKLKEGEMFDESWEEMLDEMKKLQSDISMASFLKKHFDDKKHASLIERVTGFVEGYDAADLNKVSAFALRDEWGHDENFRQYRLEGGYGKLMDYLKEKCNPDKINFLLSKVVDQIEWKDGHVKVSTQKGEIFEASKVIITLPVGVLINSRISFNPPIPDYLQAVKGFGFGGVIKFLVEFKAALWENRSSDLRYMPSLGFLFSDAMIPTWWSQSPKQVPLLTGWLAGPKAEGIHKNEAALFQEAVQALSYLLGSNSHILQNQIKAFKVINWIDDPFSFGAYAYATLETATARKILNKAIANTLFFAGEALYEGPEMGTVEAALGSGSQVTKRLGL